MKVFQEQWVYVIFTVEEYFYILAVSDHPEEDLVAVTYRADGKRELSRHQTLEGFSPVRTIQEALVSLGITYLSGLTKNVKLKRLIREEVLVNLGFPHLQDLPEQIDFRRIIEVFFEQIEKGVFEVPDLASLASEP